MSSLPQRRRSYNTELKLRVIEFAEENGNRAAEREFDVSEACVRLWRKQKDMLVQLPWYRKAARPGMKAFWPELENDLFNWIQLQRQLGYNITLKGIQNKAVELSTDRKYEIPPGVFKGNISWVNRFMKRHTISLRCRKSDGTWHFPITSCHKIQKQILAEMGENPDSKCDGGHKSEVMDDNSLLSMEVTLDIIDDRKDNLIPLDIITSNQKEEECNSLEDIKSDPFTTKQLSEDNQSAHKKVFSLKKSLNVIIPAIDNKCDSFWLEISDIFQACQLKYINPNWGPKKVIEAIKNSIMTEGRLKLILKLYCYNPVTDKIYLREQSPHLPQRECVTRERLSELMLQMHSPCHLSFEVIYETLRQRYYPCVHSVMKAIFKQEVLSSCSSCYDNEDNYEFKAKGLRNPILVKYPNSRWQVCVKRLIPCREYNYVCLITDCYSRFSFGEAMVDKTFSDIAQLLTRTIYLLGAPRIIHMDNNNEFSNRDLTNALHLLDTEKFPGCPYCPLNQGIVEEFNRMLLKQLQDWLDSSDEKNWPDRLQEMLYVYNNADQKATKPDTPYQRYFSRPNFATIFLSPQPEKRDLSEEEKLFLDMAGMDVCTFNESDEEDN